MNGAVINHDFALLFLEKNSRMPASVLLQVVKINLQKQTSIVLWKKSDENSIKEKEGFKGRIVQLILPFSILFFIILPPFAASEGNFPVPSHKRITSD